MFNSKKILEQFVHKSISIIRRKLSKVSQRTLLIGGLIFIFIVAMGIEAARQYHETRILTSSFQDALNGTQNTSNQDVPKLLAITLEHIKIHYQELVDTDKKLQGYNLLSNDSFKDRSHMRVIVNDIEHYVEVKQEVFSKRDQIASELKEKLYAAGVDVKTTDEFWEGFIKEYNDEKLLENEKAQNETILSFMHDISELYSFMIKNYTDYTIGKDESVNFKTESKKKMYEDIRARLAVSGARYVEAERALTEKAADAASGIPQEEVEQYFYR